MSSRCNDELRHVRRGRSLDAHEVLADREHVVDVKGGRLREHYRNCRTVFIRSADLRIDGSHLHVDLVSVSCGPVMIVIAVDIAFVDVQHCRFGVEAEESQAKEDRDRPHLGTSLPESGGRHSDHGRYGNTALI